MDLVFLLSWERVYLNGHRSVELFSVSADALHFGPVGVGVEAVEHEARTIFGVTKNLLWVEHRLLLAHDLLLAEALHDVFATNYSTLRPHYGCGGHGLRAKDTIITAKRYR